MNAKRLILFFLRGPGLILVIIFGIFAVCYYVGKGNAAKRAAEAAKQQQRDLGQVVASPDTSNTAPKEKILLNRPLTPVNQAPETAPVTAQASPVPPALALAAFYEDIPVSTTTPAPAATPPTVQYWLPPAEFIPCALVNTVESSHINTPVVGIVTHDVWQKNDGKPHRGPSILSDESNPYL